MTPDVNVLVAASRNDHPHHAVARAWLERAVSAGSAGASFTLMPMVVASFLRLVTSSRVFSMPTPLVDAIGFVDALLAAPGGRTGAPRCRMAGASAAVPEQRPGRQRFARCLPGGGNTATRGASGPFDRDSKKLLGRAQVTLLVPAIA